LEPETIRGSMPTKKHEYPKNRKSPNSTGVTNVLTPKQLAFRLAREKEMFKRVEFLDELPEDFNGIP
jgi:hypothetical protein